MGDVGTGVICSPGDRTRVWKTKLTVLKPNGHPVKHLSMVWLFQVSTLIQLKIFEKNQRKREVKANEAACAFCMFLRVPPGLAPGSVNAA